MPRTVNASSRILSELLLVTDLVVLFPYILGLENINVDWLRRLISYKDPYLKTRFYIV